MKINKITSKLILAGLITGWLVFIALLLPWSEVDVQGHQLAHVQQSGDAGEYHGKMKEVSGYSAKAVAVYDVRNRDFIYTDNHTESFPIASITKVITALAAQDLLSGDDEVVIGDRASRVDDITGRLRFNTRWKVEDLIKISLVASSNRASEVLAIRAQEEKGVDFVEEMNRVVQEIGLSDTYLINSTGLDIVGQYGGSYSTAHDIAKLFAHVVSQYSGLMTPTTTHSISVSDVSGRQSTIINTNQQVGNIPGLIASKTGYTSIAGGNLAVAFDSGLNRPIVVVVLGSSRNDRFEDVGNLTQDVFNYLGKQ